MKYFVQFCTWIHYIGEKWWADFWNFAMLRYKVSQVEYYWFFRRTLCRDQENGPGANIIYAMTFFRCHHKKKITDESVWGSGWPINVSIPSYGAVITANISVRQLSTLSAVDVRAGCSFLFESAVFHVNAFRRHPSFFLQQRFKRCYITSSLLESLCSGDSSTKFKEKKFQLKTPQPETVRRTMQQDNVEDDV